MSMVNLHGYLISSGLKSLILNAISITHVLMPRLADAIEDSKLTACGFVNRGRTEYEMIGKTGNLEAFFRILHNTNIRNLMLRSSYIQPTV
jgi:hypothetical protein